MKTWSKYLTIILAIGLITACGDKPDRPTPILTQQQIDAANSRAAAQSTSAPIGNVQHYYCPNACAGSGGGTAGSCPTCGTAYVHNQAWHDMQGNQTATPGAPTAGVTQPAITPPVNQTPEPPQNANGVWHYTCTAGCAGGAGSATACATCGATLVHNSAYH